MAATRRRLRHGFLMIALTSLALLREASAQLHVEGDPGPLDTITVLQVPEQSFDVVYVTVALRKEEEVTSSEITKFDSSIITNSTIERLDADPILQHTNFTLTFEFDEMVGETLYTFTVSTSRDNTYSIEGSYRVAGVSLRDSDNNLVSSIGASLSAGNYADNLKAPETLSVRVVPFLDTEQPAQALAGATVKFDPSTVGGTYQEEVQYSTEDCQLVNMGRSGELPERCGIGINEDGTLMKIQISPYRVGYGEFRITLNYPGIFDPDDPLTVISHTIVVEVDTDLPPPPVFHSKTIFADYYGGEEHTLVGYNLAFPARKEPLTRGELAVDGTNELWAINVTRTNTELEPDMPDQIVYFSTRPQPENRVEYEGTVAIVFFGLGEMVTAPSVSDDGSETPITIKYRSSSLASTLTSELAPSVMEDADKVVLNVDIAMQQYDPSTYSINKFEQTCQSLLRTVGGGDRTECALVNMGEPDDFPGTQNERSSARQMNTDGLIANYQVAVPIETWEEEAIKLEESIQRGGMAEDILVNPSTLRLFNNRRPAPAPETPTPSPYISAKESTAGLAPWAIGLIAILTALAMVMLVGCCLFVIYKRDDDEDTESRVSSKADMSIPKPDDTSYQQAVVRDGFGRGEMDESEVQVGLGTEDGVVAEYPQLNS